MWIRLRVEYLHASVKLYHVTLYQCSAVYYCPCGEELTFPWRFDPTRKPLRSHLGGVSTMAPGVRLEMASKDFAPRDGWGGVKGVGLSFSCLRLGSSKSRRSAAGLRLVGWASVHGPQDGPGEAWGDSADDEEVGEAIRPPWARVPPGLLTGTLRVGRTSRAALPRSRVATGVPTTARVAV